jgi:hypothetical protein
MLVVVHDDGLFGAGRHLRKKPRMARRSWAACPLVLLGFPFGSRHLG